MSLQSSNWGRSHDICMLTHSSSEYQFDTDGNAIDLTSGNVEWLGGAYVWYGLTYGCGKVFCGVASYSSPDLTTWHYNGYLFDPDTAEIQAFCSPPLSGNCGRPHIVYSTANNQYVLWGSTKTLLATPSSPAPPPQAATSKVQIAHS